MKILLASVLALCLTACSPDTPTLAPTQAVYGFDVARSVFEAQSQHAMDCGDFLPAVAPSCALRAFCEAHDCAAVVSELTEQMLYDCRESSLAWSCDAGDFQAPCQQDWLHRVPGI